MKRGVRDVVLFTAAFVMLLPLLLIFFGSFMSTKEFQYKLGAVLEEGQGMASFSLLPDYPTMQGYVMLLLDTPEFFVMFWNSCIQVIPVIIGQLLISAPASWAFARFQFRGRKALLFLYMILMILPFQVTMVSSYFVLNRFHLLDTHLAVILPNIFSTFPVFILIKFFRAVPESLLEAAKLDGAGSVSIFCRIGVPMGKSGILSVFLLDFLEYWNAIEQPITFLKNKTLWPVTMYLTHITSEKAGVSFAASFFVMLPGLFFFYWGQDYLEQGIMASGIKE